MAFEVGAEVVVKTLANKRGVIVQAAPEGRYRVRLESVTVWCRERDLEAPSPATKTKARAASRKPGSPRSGETTPALAARVDLHRLTVEEALVRVVDALDRAILAGADRLEVVHGKGSGRIKHAVHRHLASIPSVRAVKIDEHNSGVTWVYL